ncbi:MAG: hypothetical protein JSS82_19810 [Bacteroidetes bacterium]|nr:hypothetical protein [Bacteroidota bacterium]
MKKSILTVFALCSLFTIADAKMKKQVKSNEIVALEISHGACFGKCPVHTIKIYNTGLVRYSGISFVQYKGIYEKKLSKPEMQKLLKEAEEYRIDTCKAQYPYVPDMPGIDYTITYKNKTQKIHNAHRGPEFLRELSDDIENAVKVDNSWKKIAANATEPRNP